MELREAIRQRHSYRLEYNDTPVTREQLRAIVQAAIDAPSGKNRQTTNFVIVDDRALVREMFARIGNGPHMRTAPAAIVVVRTRDETGDRMDFGLQDYSAAIENMMLTITELGLASVWIEGQLLDGAAGDIAKMLDVPAPHEVRVVLPIGHPSEPVAPREKKPFDERAWFNGYGRSNG